MNQTKHKRECPTCNGHGSHDDRRMGEDGARRCTTCNGTGSVIEIRCPKGHTGPFRYLEDVISHRDVGGVRHYSTGGAALAIDGFYEIYDDGDNPRLECRHGEAFGEVFCGLEFPIPEGVTPEFD